MRRPAISSISSSGSGTGAGGLGCFFACGLTMAAVDGSAEAESAFGKLSPVWSSHAEEARARCNNESEIVAAARCAD